MVVKWNKAKCIRCGGCVGVCPKAALELEESGVTVNEKDCINCGTCEKFCPVGALKVKKK
jgi:NAD-dependent dihydropyrimidine dehydrogenase PreA subunit